MDAVAHALADPIRRDILRMLRDQPVNAGRLAQEFSVSRPAVSRHLRVLREAGLVSDDLIGRERVYQLMPGPLAELEAFLADLRAPGPWEHRLMALETEVHRVKRRRQAAGAAPHRSSGSSKESK
jgi:DNA-binding transcriptional ArsR family regulator